MVHMFRLDAAVAAILSEPHADGHVLELDCRTETGEDCRLRLDFTGEGIVRFAEIVAKLLESYQHAFAEDELPPAAEPPTTLAQDAEHRRIERYFVAHMLESELRLLAGTLRSLDGDATRAAEFDGHRRIVLWKVPDPHVQNDSDAGFRVYLSAGALWAAAQASVPVEVVGEISRHELPDGRELLVGDPPLDWQHTTTPSAVSTVDRLAGSDPRRLHTLPQPQERPMNETTAAPAGPPVGASRFVTDHTELDVELRHFVAEHPDGWNHAEWLALVERLRERGLAHDAEAIGQRLEKQRLMMTLAHVRGVGMKRMQSITERYPDLWSLRQAGTDDLAGSVGIPRALAERIQEAV